ncbi:MAG: LPP20 family lipoprotein [Spirochaetales bacterium]|nr:LPP20 family lipoprotein [Spirochaetales bacterium]
MKLLTKGFAGLRAVLALAVFFGSTAGLAAQSSAPPLWLTDLNAAYPEAKYLSSVGSGANRRNAEDDATGGLARLFSVQVKVDSVAQQRYAEFVKGDKSYTESEMAVSQTVGTQASEQFVNLRFSDPYSDAQGTVHVAAYIEREPTASIYRSLIQKDLKKLDDFFGRASSVTGVFKRYAFYDAAYSVGLNAERLLGQLRIIHANTARPLEALLDLKKVASARDREASGLTYTMDISGDEDQRLAGIVRKTLDGMSLSYREGGRLSVKGSWSVQPVTINPQFKSVQWTVNISLYNEAGTAIATFTKQARQNGATDSQAVSLAYREVEKSMTKDFLGSIQSYVTQAVTGG